MLRAHFGVLSACEDVPHFKYFGLIRIKVRTPFHTAQAQHTESWPSSVAEEGFQTKLRPSSAASLNVQCQLLKLTTTR